MTIGSGGTVTASLHAEYASNLFVIGPHDCATADVVDQATSAGCDPSATLTVTGVSG